MSTADDRLIEQHITDVRTADPHKRNEPVIRRTGTPVWVVVAYCQRARKGAVEQTAADYGLTEEEVQAALAYYRRHPELDVWKGKDAMTGYEWFAFIGGTTLLLSLAFVVWKITSH